MGGFFFASKLTFQLFLNLYCGEKMIIVDPHSSVMGKCRFIRSCIFENINVWTFDIDDLRVGLVEFRTRLYLIWEPVKNI